MNNSKMSVVDGSEASIDKVDGDEKEAAASAIPNNNSEPDERKARMALMVAKLQDADHQSMVDYAEEVGSRLDNAITNKSEWEQTDDRGVPSEKKIRDVELRTATDEIEKAKKMHWEARGDYAETCPPSQATTSYAPVMAVGDGLAPLTTAPSWSLITPPERTPGYRWPLYQFLREAHVAGKPCPKAQEVLDAWKLNPPSGLKVIQSGRCDALEYELVHGGKKIADLRAIQAAINDLVIRIDRTAAK